MNDQTPKPIDWADTYGIYSPSDDLAAVDWTPVVSYDAGGSYDWTTFHAFWSPSARRFFWHGDSWRSCNWWGDNLHRPSDFYDGDKAALQRAFREFAEEKYLDAGDALRTADQIARFKTGDPR